MSEKIYGGELSEAGWAILARLLEPPLRRGHPCKHVRRLVLNAILYVAVRRRALASATARRSLG